MQFSSVSGEAPCAEEHMDSEGIIRTCTASYPSSLPRCRTGIVRGKNDPIFKVKGAEAFWTDLPKAEIHYLDAGHFALETNAAGIAGYIREFMPRTQGEAQLTVR